MPLTKAFALLLFAFFFTALAGCRTTVSIGDLEIGSELKMLQSVNLKVEPVDQNSPQDDPEPDL